MTAVVAFLLGEINLVAMGSFLERGALAGRVWFLWMGGNISLVLRERAESADRMDEIWGGLSLTLVPGKLGLLRVTAPYRIFFLLN